MAGEGRNGGESKSLTADVRLLASCLRAGEGEVLCQRAKDAESIGVRTQIALDAAGPACGQSGETSVVLPAGIHETGLDVPRASQWEATRFSSGALRRAGLRCGREPAGLSVLSGWPADSPSAYDVLSG